MSSGIMERNLPVAESLGSGDKVRIVTAAGNSKNIDASEIGGGGVLLINAVYSNDDTTLDKTWKEIHDAYMSGIHCLVYNFSEVHGFKCDSVISVTYSIGITCPYGVETNDGSFSAKTETGYPSINCDQIS